MKDKKEKQYAGIWFDTTKAILITSDTADGKHEFVIGQRVKAEHNHSGGNEHTINNAKHSENQKYFKSVTPLLLPFDEILIFGPGEAQEQLLHYLKEDKQFQNKKITLASAAQMTDNQMVAKVQDFFAGH